MAVTVSCRNPDCPEVGIAKGFLDPVAGERAAAGETPDAVLCGACGSSCVVDDG